MDNSQVSQNAHLVFVKPQEVIEAVAIGRTGPGAVAHVVLADECCVHAETLHLFAERCHV